MVDGTCPTPESDRRDFHERLALTQMRRTADDHRDDAHSVPHDFRTSLPGDAGIDTMFRDEFLGLSLFAYNEPGGDGAQSRACLPRA